MTSFGFIKGIDRMKRVCVLGAGAFGTAFASLLADNGFEVTIWCYESFVVDDITQKRCNETFLPGVKLSENIKPFTNMAYALEDAGWVFEAIPVKFLRSILQKAKPYVTDEQRWVVLSKGIENGTLLFPSQVIDDVFEKKMKKAVVAGPSFAKNIACKQMTGVDIACEDLDMLAQLQRMLENDYFKCHMTSDIIGVQVGGSLKNILAIATGMLDGAGYPDNTKAFLLTEGLHEMALFAEHVGADAQTLYGLSGVGDLVLTCMGGLSRNLMVGKHLGKGETLDAILKRTGVVPEGANTVKSVYQIITRESKDVPKFELQDFGAHIGQGKKVVMQGGKINMPIFESMYEILYGGKTVEYLLKVLKA